MHKVEQEKEGRPMYRIALSTNQKTVDEALFAAYRTAGIAAMEITGDLRDYDCPALVTWAEKYGVELWTYHIPFAPFDRIDPSFLDEEKRRSSVAEQETLIHMAAGMGIKRYVIHASGEPIPQEERPARMAQAKKSLRELAQVADECGGVLCVEDLPRTCLGRNSDEMLELLSADDRLRACLDTNHLLAEELTDYIRRVGDKLLTVHVSDYDFINERHWLPGEGGIDWQAVLAALQDVGYDGPWLYEIAFACPKTICRDRDLTCEDFARNARELFADKPLTTIHTSKPNLGMWG